MSQFNIEGRLITLNYKGGEVKVLLPPDVSAVKRIVTDPSRAQNRRRRFSTRAT